MEQRIILMQDIYMYTCIFIKDINYGTNTKYLTHTCKGCLRSAAIIMLSVKAICNYKLELIIGLVTIHCK